MKSQTQHDDADESSVFAEWIGHRHRVFAGVFALSDRDVNLSLLLITLLLDLQTNNLELMTICEQ